MAKPKNRFFIIGNNSDDLTEGCVMTRELAEAHAAMCAADGDEYIFVAELISTYWQERSSGNMGYMNGDAEVGKYED